MLSRKFPTSSENTAELVGQVKFSNLLIVHLQRTAGSEKLQRRSKLYPKGQLRAESRPANQSSFGSKPKTSL